MNDFVNCITDKISCHNNIYIYGAGNNSKYLWLYLKSHDIDIEGFLVTNIGENPTVVFGKNVYSVHDERTKGAYILVPFKKFSKAYIDTLDMMVELQTKDAIFLPDQYIEYIKKEVIDYTFSVGEYKIEKNINVEREYGIFSYPKDKKERAYWRFAYPFIQSNNLENLSQYLEFKSIFEEYCKQYGEYCNLTELKIDNVNEKPNAKIFMATGHLDTKKLKLDVIPKWIQSIQVGAALTKDRVCEINDADGNNISEKNRNYSECTALYWMSKNVTNLDYIGLCHYRRHLHFTEDMLNNLETNGVDVVVTRPTFELNGIRNFFEGFLPKADFDFLNISIKKLYPDYLEFSNQLLSSNFLIPCNLFLMKYSIFQEYTRFAFDITFEIEKMYAELGIDRNDRYIGYIMECLLNIYIMANKNILKVAYTDMIYFD